MVLLLEGQRHVGGVAYAIVEATETQLVALMKSPRTYEAIVPRTKAAEMIPTSGSDLHAEFHQGNALIDVSYTLWIRPEIDQHQIRFWLDRRRPHPIEDAWGYFRFQPLSAPEPGRPRTLVAFGVLVHARTGLAQGMVESKIQAALLSIPQKLRAYVARQIRRTGSGDMGAHRPKQPEASL